MQKYLLLCFGFFLWNSSIKAQIVDRSLVAGFATSTELIVPYGTDKWLIAGLGEPELGAFFRDTLFVSIIGNDGAIVWRKNINLPLSEKHFWHDLLALPDGGMLISFESTLCDVGADVLTIQRLDSQGNLLWQKAGGFVFGTSRPPEKWFLAADGQLLGVAYDQVWKVSTNTGSVLWTAEMQGVLSGDASFFEVVKIPDSEDFFAIGNPTFQHWIKTGPTNAPEYVLYGSLDNNGYYRSLTVGPNATFYSWRNFPESRIERIDLNFDLTTLPIPLIYAGEKDMAVGEQGLYLSESSLGDFKVTRFDLEGENPVSLLPPGNSLSPKAIATNQGWLAIGGEEGSGLPTVTGGYNCTGAWFRAIQELNPLLESLTPNVGVTAIKQHSLIDTTSFPFPPIGPIYNLNGGDFDIEISNFGDIFVNEVSVNVLFKGNQFIQICFNRPAKSIRFFNLNLAPGAATWVNFGDIEAIGQPMIPSEICFWTSSPNEEPDAVHENDRACHPASYTVAIKNPNINQVALFPNPSDDFTELALPEKMEGEPWQIFDAAGRVVSSGVCTAVKTLRLETTLLRSGFYLLRLKNRVGKLVVQH